MFFYNRVLLHTFYRIQPNFCKTEKKPNKSRASQIVIFFSVFVFGHQNRLSWVACRSTFELEEIHRLKNFPNWTVPCTWSYFVIHIGMGPSAARSGKWSDAFMNEYYTSNWKPKLLLGSRTLLGPSRNLYCVTSPNSIYSTLSGYFSGFSSEDLQFARWLVGFEQILGNHYSKIVVRNNLLSPLFCLCVARKLTKVRTSFRFLFSDPFVQSGSFF